VPVPARTIVSVAACDCRAKDALIATPEDTVKVHEVDVPEQIPPDHPPNLEPFAGVAVSVTAVPSVNVAVQAAPQLIWPSLLVITPEPAPETLIVTDAFWGTVVVDVLLAPPPEQPTTEAAVNAKATMTITHAKRRPFGAKQVADGVVSPPLHPARPGKPASANSKRRRRS